MTKSLRLRTEHVDLIPDELEVGVIYVSRRYRTASHLCCCGCGREVVTPLSAAKWRITESAGKVSLMPSIGNWSFPCRSHYWIERGDVRWAGAMSPAQIARVQAHDRADVVAASRSSPSPAMPPPTLLRSIGLRVNAALAAIRQWLKT